MCSSMSAVNVTHCKINRAKNTRVATHSSSYTLTSSSHGSRIIQQINKEQEVYRPPSSALALGCQDESLFRQLDPDIFYVLTILAYTFSSWKCAIRIFILKLIEPHLWHQLEYKVMSSVPSIEPCGTPHFTLRSTDKGYLLWTSTCRGPGLCSCAEEHTSFWRCRDKIKRQDK